MSIKLKTTTKNGLTEKIQDWGKRHITLVKLIVSILYLVGISGMAMPELRPYFQLLTPFHLLMTAGVMLMFHRDWNIPFLIFVALAWTLGYTSEVLGVHTGFPFGNYAYGPVLGIQLMKVPLMIGVNWLILVYLSGAFLKNLIRQDWLASLMGALMMVLIDFAIEPVAIALDFWSWEGNEIPISNYLGWLGVAFIIHMIYRKLQFQKENQIATFLLLNLVAFFVILNFIL